MRSLWGYSVSLGEVQGVSPQGSVISRVCQFQLAETVIPVQGSALRTVLGSLGLHQDPGSPCGLAPAHRCAVIPYLNNILILGELPHEVEQSFQMPLQVLTRAGFIVNLKSDLAPTQDLVY